jgi:hypothetical protein
MDKDGIEVINEHHGTTYKGAWLSNTYAWSSPSNIGAVILKVMDHGALQ